MLTPEEIEAAFLGAQWVAGSHPNHLAAIAESYLTNGLKERFVDEMDSGGASTRGAQGSGPSSPCAPAWLSHRHSH